jgi:hypothetical protein
MKGLRMFVQIMQGACNDAAGARGLLERWAAELQPGATGWLGTTAGVTADGELIAVARFASPADARANSDRPEQGEWWSEFTKHFDGEVTVHDCLTAELWLGGGSDDAGFVQVMQSEVLDRDAARAIIERMSTMTPQDMGRTDVLGSTIAWHSDDDGLTQVVYFTSEAEAREGEASESAADDERFADMATAFTEPRYLDISDPWLFSPRRGG